MSRFGGDIAISLNKGAKINIKAQVDTSIGIGAFAEVDDIKLNGGLQTPVNGFIQENPDVGVITPLDDCLGITYEHVQSSENKLYFVSRFGDMTLVSIVHVPVHDHSSVAQGGPAYGTYASEYADTQNQAQEG